MIRNKKYILWSLLIGMICVSTEQVRADFLYDDNGEFTYEGYVFTGSATIATIAATYATYRYLYPSKKDEAQGPESCQKNKTVDSAALISIVLAAQAMAIVCINHGVEENIRKPRREEKEILNQSLREKEESARQIIREEKERADQSLQALREKNIVDNFNKIVEDCERRAEALKEQELLNYEEELAWKNNNNITSLDILTEEQKIQLLKIKLKNIKKSDSMKIPVIARLTQGCSYGNLIALIKEAQILAMQQGDEFLDMRHINMVYYHATMGQKDKKYIRSDADLVKTAFHEAGHAFVVVTMNNKNIIHEVTIEPRRYKSNNPTCLGCMQVLRIYKNQLMFDWTEDDFEKEVMMYLAGGISEQVADLPYKLKEEDREHGSLSDFLSRPGVRSDVEYARVCVFMIAELRRRKNNHWFRENEDVIMQEVYKKTFKLVKEKRLEIKKIAMPLLEKKTMSGDEVHELLGIPKKKYDFEMKYDFEQETLV